MAHDIVISYSSQDKAIADAVCARIENRGIRCWIAPRDVLPGEEWGKAIIVAIENCRAVVVIFSSNSNESGQVLREVERAVHNNKIIIPFRIEDVMPSKSMQLFLSVHHWLDAITPPLESHIEKLGTIINTLLKQSNGASPNEPKTEKVYEIPKQHIFKKRRIVIIGGTLLTILICIVTFITFRSLNWSPINQDHNKNTQTSNESSFVLQAQSSSLINVKLTYEAWEAYNGEKYKQAIEKAQECIDKYEIEAIQEQEKLEKNNVPLPPVSNVSDKEEKEIINRGILNDVATCWYIIGRSYEGRGHRYKHEAIQAYSKVAQFSHALTYDPNGDHFWSPAQAAIARASLLENSKIAKSTPNTTIESAKEPSDLNEINTNQPAGVSKENLNDKIVVAEKLPDKKENKEMFEKQRVYPPNEKQYSNILAPEERFPANLVFQEDQQVECELVGFEHPSGTFGIPPREKGPIFLYYLKLDTMPDGHYSVDTTGGRGVKAHFKDIKLILFDERVGKNFRKVVIEYKYGIKERGYTFNNLSFSCCNKKTNDYFKVSTERLNQVIFK